MTEKMKSDQNDNPALGLARLAKVARAAITLGAMGAAEVMGFRTDSFENLLTGLNTKRDKKTHARVKEVEPLTPEDIRQLYNGDDIAAKMCEALSEDGLREGIRLIDPQPDEKNKDGDTRVKLLNRACRSKRFQILSNFHRANSWGRAYGRSAIMLGMSGDPLTERQPDEKILYITVLDRRDFSVAQYSRETGEPELWRLNTGCTPGQPGDQLVHDSRLIFFGGVMTADRDRMSMQWSDYSVLQRPFEILRDYHTVWGSTVHLTADASQSVYSVRGLFDAIISGDVEPLLLRMSMLDEARSSVRGMLIDAEGEKFERTTTSFTGLGEVNIEARVRISAAANMPVTRLFGISPAGLNATGESDTRGWYATVKAWQTLQIKDELEEVINLIAYSEGLGTGWTVEFPSLWDLNPIEESTLKKNVSDRYINEIDKGLLLVEEVTGHLYGGKPDAWVTDIYVDPEDRVKFLTATSKDPDDKKDPIP